MFSCYKNKKVLVTGSTGFKGSWLIRWLLELGADVIGVSIDIPTKPSLYESIQNDKLIKNYKTDIRNFTAINKIIYKEKPNFIFHLAAQAIVSSSIKDPMNTYLTNTIGSLNILESLKNYNHDVVVIMITSDKVYENVESIWGYRENDIIGGKDPYSASKSMAEIGIRSYFLTYLSNKKNIRLATVRAGNVIGGGDWAANRIVPDCMRSWKKNKVTKIRNPGSTRPWQHVLEPLSGYLLIGAKLKMNKKRNGESYNFGPNDDNNFSVKHLINEIQLNCKNFKWKGVSKKSQNYEAGLLKLNCDKALSHLSWFPVLNFKETIKMTIDWYKEYYANNKGIKAFTINQIKEYNDKALQQKISWTRK